MNLTKERLIEMIQEELEEITSAKTPANPVDFIKHPRGKQFQKHYDYAAKRSKRGDLGGEDQDPEERTAELEEPSREFAPKSNFELSALDLEDPFLSNKGKKQPRGLPTSSDYYKFSGKLSKQGRLEEKYIKVKVTKN